MNIKLYYQSLFITIFMNSIKRLLNQHTIVTISQVTIAASSIWIGLCLFNKQAPVDMELIELEKELEKCKKNQNVNMIK